MGAGAAGEQSSLAGDRGSSGQAKAEHGSRCQRERRDQSPQESWAAGLDGEETRGEDMAESVTRAEARSSQRAKDSAWGPAHCALGELLLTCMITTTLLSGIEDAV